jgi:hypothetical protein
MYGAMGGAGFVAGIAGGFCFICCYIVVILSLGCTTGMITFAALVVLFYVLQDNGYPDDDTLYILLGADVVFGMIIAFVFWKLQKLCIMIGTAHLGYAGFFLLSCARAFSAQLLAADAAMSHSNALCLCFYYRAQMFVHGIFQGFNNQLQLDSDAQWIPWALIIVFSISGFFVQWCWTSKGVEIDPRSGQVPGDSSSISYTRPTGHRGLSCTARPPLPFKTTIHVIDSRWRCVISLAVLQVTVVVVQTMSPGNPSLQGLMQPNAQYPQQPYQQQGYQQQQLSQQPPPYQQQQYQQPAQQQPYQQQPYQQQQYQQQGQQQAYQQQPLPQQPPPQQQQYLQQQQQQQQPQQQQLPPQQQQQYLQQQYLQQQYLQQQQQYLQQQQQEQPQQEQPQQEQEMQQPTVSDAKYS